MDELAKVPSGQLLSSGLFPGLLGDAAPLWIDGRNVVFENGGIRKAFGLLGLETLVGRPTGLKATVAETEPRCFVGVGQDAFRYRTADGLTAIGSFAAAGGVFQFVPWDTQVLINNTVDPVELWPNAGLSAPITAPFNRANVIFKYGLRALAGGTDNGGQLVEWSSINSVTDWTPTTLNSAGSLRLRELEGDIVAAKPIGGSIGIYGRSNAGLFSEIGGTTTFGFRRPIAGVSAISAHSVIAAGNRHYGITRENAFITDLVSSALIDEPAIRRFLRNNADWSRMSEVYGWPDWAQSLVRWTVPVSGGGHLGIGYRTDNQTWTIFEDDVLCGEESGPFEHMLLAKQARFLRQDRTTGNNDSSAMTAYARTKPLDFGRRNMAKRVMRVSVDGSWSGSPTLRIGFSNHPNETPVFNAALPLANDIYPDQEATRVEAPYLTFEIRSEAVDTQWDVSGLTIYGTETSFEP